VYDADLLPVEEGAAPQGEAAGDKRGTGRNDECLPGALQRVRYLATRADDKAVAGAATSALAMLVASASAAGAPEKGGRDGSALQLLHCGQAVLLMAASCLLWSYVRCSGSLPWLSSPPLTAACVVVGGAAAAEAASSSLVWVAEDWAHKKRTRASLAGLKELVSRSGSEGGRRGADPSSQYACSCGVLTTFACCCCLIVLIMGKYTCI
jgi:hypothetical protein